MITFYLRSSLLGSVEFCEQKAFLVYSLGFKDKENKKANLGSVVHKALELLGRVKISDPKRKTIEDDELGRIKKSNCTIEKLTKLSLAHYEKKTQGLVNSSDLKLCVKWVEKAITYNDCTLDPRNQNISNVEEFFDIELKQDWARYEYEVNGEKIVGQLRIRGTVDVIIHEYDNYYRILDYKTGKRLNWATEKVKTYDDLQKDKQLLFYYYALCNKYKEEGRDFYVSIFYINDHKIDKKLVKGGIFDLHFDEDDYYKAEKMIKEEFEKIKNISQPKVISSTCSHWKCKYLCAFSDIIPEISTDEPACMAISRMIKEKGIDKVTDKYIDLDKSMSYQDGGGRSSDTEKKHEKT